MDVAIAKKTPLSDCHRQRGAKMTQFEGWELPLSFTGILEEHRQVRRAAGVFDVSHMGRLLIRDGKGLDRVTTNSMPDLELGQVRYTLICNREGGVEEDLLVYRGDQGYTLVVNAANAGKVERLLTEAGLSPEAVPGALLALQGPRAAEILQPLTQPSPTNLRRFRFIKGEVAGKKAVISRTGYTGEDGFEIFLPAEAARAVWDVLLQAGAVPAGLGARDTLRTEAGMVLYGHELSPQISPLEAGLDNFVDLSKDFIGRQALLHQKREGLTRRLAGLEMLSPGIPRQGYQVYREDAPVGRVTSGIFSPSLEKGIAMALITPAAARLGRELQVEIRGKKIPARVVKMPFYGKESRK